MTEAVTNANLFDVSSDQHQGVMIALYPPLGVAQQLANLDGVTIPAEEMHITLGYAGSADNLTDEQVASAILATRDVASMNTPLIGNINGIGRFNASTTSDGQDVIYAVVDVPGLDRVRSVLGRILDDRDIEISRQHGFNPHITLAYVEPGAPFPLQTLPTMRLNLGELSISVGDKRTTFPLGGMRVNEDTTMQFVINQAGGATRWAERRGRRYLVAPVVTINEGVLNGELVRAEEFSKYPQTWNGRPVTLGHPKQGEFYISANDLDILDASIGTLWNVSVNDRKKRGEIWLDEAKCKELGGPAELALNRLVNGEQVEVSTSYFRDLIDEDGEWEGKPYRGIAVNLRPDHLAILLDTVGACSWKDGCGAPRVNESQEEPVVTNDASAAQAASQSFISELVRAVIKTFGGNKNMDREKTIQGLAANCRCKLNKDQLTALDDQTLTALAETLTPVANTETETPAAVVPAPVAAAPVVEMPKQITEFVAMLDGIGGVDKLGAALAAITANADQERTGLIDTLVANEQCVLSKEELGALATPTLKRLVSQYTPRSYFGNVGVTANAADDDEVYVLEMPTPWGDKK